MTAFNDILGLTGTDAMNPSGVFMATAISACIGTLLKNYNSILEANIITFHIFLFWRKHFNFHHFICFFHNAFFINNIIIPLNMHREENEYLFYNRSKRPLNTQYIHLMMRRVILCRF